MKVRLKKGVLYVLLSSAVLLVGCLDKEEEDSKLPWTKPASWETSGPGMGGFIPY